MKRIILTLIVILSLGFGKTLNIGELVIREGIAYKVNSKTPYTGEVKGYFNNGQVRVTKTYRRGKIQGKSAGYHDNGQLHWEAFYENGLRKITYENTTIITYSRDGKREFEIPLKGGKIHGLVKRYGSSKIPGFEISFQNGDFSKSLQERVGQIEIPRMKEIQRRLFELEIRTINSVLYNPDSFFRDWL